jgi:hypothetical protein
VDADASPVREEVYRVAARLGVAVVVVHNGSRPIRPPGLDFVRVVIVGAGADAADDWIAERIGAADVCVTADIPLASRCLQAGARALDHAGHEWTTGNIGAALAGRDISRLRREMGLPTSNRPPMAAADRSRFLNTLDRLVQAARRAEATPRAT